MTLMHSDDEVDVTVLKSDALGRPRVPKEKREAILDEFEKSGLSGVRFAEQYGINYSTFAAWRQRRNKERERSGKPAAGGKRENESFTFLEVVQDEPVQPTQTSSNDDELIVELGGSLKLRVDSERQVDFAVKLIKSLNR